MHTSVDVSGVDELRDGPGAIVDAQVVLRFDGEHRQVSIRVSCGERERGRKRQGEGEGQGERWDIHSSGRAGTLSSAPGMDTRWNLTPRPSV